MRAGITGINAVILIDQRLVSMLLCPQGAGDILAAPHGRAALVIQAEDGRHHVRSTLSGFQCGRDLLLISDPARCRRGSGTETCGQYTGIALAGHTAPAAYGRMPFRAEIALAVSLGHHACGKQQPAGNPPASAVRAGQGWSFSLWGKHTGLLRIPWVETIFSNKSLLFHSRLCAQSPRYIVDIPHLAPQGGFSCRFAAIHLLSSEKTIKAICRRRAAKSATLLARAGVGCSKRGG